MKKSLLIVPVAMGLLFAACGGGGGEGGGGEEAAPAPKAAPKATVDPATAGKVTGTVMLEGEAPEQDTIQMAADPNCARLHDSPVHTQFVVTGDNGGLANVFVYVKSGLEGMSFPTPTEPVEIDQQGCQYHPHVLGLQVGQQLEIVNSDDTLHNIHAMPKKNKEFNIGQPVKGLKTEHSFDTVEVMIPFKCDVHKWMNSYAGVLDHPYFAVTGTDGAFELPNLPPGDYVVEAWHERYGTKEMNVTVPESGTAEASFTFSAAAE